MAVDITATKPAKQPGNPSWATNVSTRVEPTSGQKATGYTSGQRPTFSVLNWLIGFLADWAKYGEDAADELDAGKLSRKGASASTPQGMIGTLASERDGVDDCGASTTRWATVWTYVLNVSLSATIQALTLLTDSLTIPTRTLSLNLPTVPRRMGSTLSSIVANYIPIAQGQGNAGQGGSAAITEFQSLTGTVDDVSALWSYAIPYLPPRSVITGVTILCDANTVADAANTQIKASIATGMLHAGPTISAPTTVTSAVNFIASANDQTLHLDFATPFTVPAGVQDLFVVFGAKHTGAGTATAVMYIHALRINYTQSKL